MAGSSAVRADAPEAEDIELPAVPEFLESLAPCGRYRVVEKDGKKFLRPVAKARRGGVKISIKKLWQRASEDARNQQISRVALFDKYVEEYTARRIEEVKSSAALGNRSIVASTSAGPSASASAGDDEVSGAVQQDVARAVASFKIGPAADVDSNGPLYELFECMICYNYILPEFWQCAFGHRMCPRCVSEAISAREPKCWHCATPQTFVQVTANTRLAESLKFRCSNGDCTVVFRGAEYIDHMRVCEFNDTPIELVAVTLPPGPILPVAPEVPVAEVPEVPRVRDNRPIELVEVHEVAYNFPFDRRPYREIDWSAVRGDAPGVSRTYDNLPPAP